MFQRLRNAIHPSTPASLARTFTHLGWIGCWLLVAMGSVPVLFAIYYFAFRSRPSGARVGLRFVDYLTIANLLVLVFTCFWSYRYTRLARQIIDPQHRPSDSHVIGVVWTGVTASTIGMLFSMLVIMIDAAGLLFFFLRAPQGGVPVIQTSGAEAPYWVSSVDMVSLMALILALFSELIVLMFNLWLLVRATLAAGNSQSADAVE